MDEKDCYKYLVVKYEDIEKYLDEEEQDELHKLCKKIHDCKYEDGKPMNNYVVCNQDEKYADEIWNTILKGETK